jgi:hypothetical protein
VSAAIVLCPLLIVHRYYYAVATFSSVAAAEFVMKECDGTEFERTANMFDLSYVPEDMDFGDDEVK